MRKSIWLRKEISIADELLSLAPKLTEEFLAYHTDFIEGNFSKGVPYINETFDTNNIKSHEHAWKIDGLKYVYKEKNIILDPFKNNEIKTRFPTAVALTERWGEDCPISTYSILEKNSVIERHTGIENRNGEFLRIHIPLIIPKGDIFLEVEGVEIDWSDLFGFDNQFIHSAYNYTDHRRLVYLIDIRRSAIGIEPGEKTNKKRYKDVPPFVRGQYPKIQHEHV
jgi:hypothetical protein